MVEGNTRRHASIWLRLMLAISMLIISVAPLARAQAPGTPAGSVTTATGTVQLQRAGATTPLAPGTAVNVGDRIITGSNGHVIVTLSDGSTLELGDSSNLTIDSHALAPAGGRAATSVSLFGGVVRSVVDATGGAPNFEVHTPNAVAAVRGTRFDTAFSEASTRPGYGDCHRFTDVSVYEGTVALRNPSAVAGTGVDIPAGYEATVPCNQGATLPGPLGMTGASAFGGAGGAPGSGAGGVVGGVPPPACPVCPSGK